MSIHFNTPYKSCFQMVSGALQKESVPFAKSTHAQKETPSRPLVQLTKNIHDLFSRINKKYYEELPSQMDHPPEAKKRRLDRPNKYQIIHEIGKGSFGNVYKVENTSSKKLYAIKISNRAKCSKDALEFEDYVLKNLNSKDPLNHHNIIRRLDFFVHKDGFALVLELHECDLFTALKQTDRGFSIELTRNFSAQIFDALSFMHDHGFIHGDVKPENVLLVNKRSSRITLADFTSSASTEYPFQKLKIQSPCFRSPEVFSELLFAPKETHALPPYTSKIDTWSMGALIVELCTKKIPFPIDKREGEKSIYKAHVKFLGPYPDKLTNRGLEPAISLGEEKEDSAEYNPNALHDLILTATVSSKQISPSPISPRVGSVDVDGNPSDFPPFKFQGKKDSTHAVKTIMTAEEDTFATDHSEGNEDELELTELEIKTILEDLVKGLLCYIPKKRLSAPDALKHKFFHIEEHHLRF